MVKPLTQRRNVAVLNAASAIRPGGGFLDGTDNQEAYICARTTLYASLWDEFYRLPEVSGIYTPDVLVFRDNTIEARELPKRDRHFIDVISSNMLSINEAKREGCTCGMSYCDKHRDLVRSKMRAVLRIAQQKGARRLVLSAWGCGNTSSNAVTIAKFWRKVIAGAPRQRRPNSEQWEGIEEIIFALPDGNIYAEFKRAFEGVLAPEAPSPAEDESAEPGEENIARSQRNSELFRQIITTEFQIEAERNGRKRRDLRIHLDDLRRELRHGPHNAEDDASPEPDAEAEDYITTGFNNSDDELPSYSINTFDSSDSDIPGAASESFEFRPGPPVLGMDSQTSHDEDSHDESLYPALSHSPNFDPQTGWFTGSMDGLTALINAGGGMRSCSRQSPRSPSVRPDSGELPGIDAEALHEYLAKHGGTDVRDY